MTSSTLKFIFNHLLEQWQQKEKQAKIEIQKFDYLENEKDCLDKNKGHFL